MKFSQILLPLLLASCTKLGGQGGSEARKDFDHICQAQKDYLSALKLKGVNQAELVVERSKKMREGITNGEAIEAVNNLLHAANKQDMVEAQAKQAGLADWKCPELYQGP